MNLALTMPSGWHRLAALGALLGVVGVLLLALPAQSPAPQAAGEGNVSSQLQARQAAIAAVIARLPSASEVDRQWALVAALATEHGLALRGAQYPDPPPRSGTLLDSAPVRLRLEGRLDAMRGFVAALQRELPALAIDRLDLSRGAAGERFEGELRGHLLLRARP